jgi:hypothetical protein
LMMMGGAKLVAGSFDIQPGRAEAC